VRLTEEEIRKLTLSAIEQLGERASPEAVKKIVKQSVDQFESDPDFQEERKSSGRIILTSFGMNKTGVIAAITKALAAAKCDIEDMSQKLMGDYFTLIMIFNIDQSTMELNEIQEEIARVADDLKIKIYLQHEEIFSKMHRI
jgi:ACT domain-containing protein